MNAAKLIRDTIGGFEGAFTSDDVWQAVKKRIQHLKWPGGAVIQELWKAKQRGEIVEVGIKREGKTIVKVWKPAREAEAK
jgi:hypothetical protein